MATLYILNYKTPALMGCGLVRALPVKNNFFIFCLLATGSLLASCDRSDKLFSSLPASTTHIDFTNHLQKQKAFGILYYLYYYNGGGVATGDINNDGLPDVYFTANSKGNNKLYLNKGNFEFEDVTEKAGVRGTADWCSGVTMADVNGDGHLDIYVSAVSGHHRLTGHNELFINNGNGTFTESGAIYGLNFSGFTTQSAFFDFDHDGDLDCYILNQSHKPNQNIVDTGNRRKFDPLAGDRLYRNDLVSVSGKAGDTATRKTGALLFTDVSAQAGIYQSSLGYGLGIAVADLNNDGWEDIYVGNDFHENDYYYVNNGNATFTESGAKHFNHYSRFSMGNDVADYNNDGQLDVITADMLPSDEKILKTYGSDENADIYDFKIIRNGFQYQYSRNCLQRNNGDGSSFSETALQSGVAATDWSWSPLFADLDNDGNKDLFITSGIVKRPVDLDYVRFVSDLYAEKNIDQTDKYDDMAVQKMPDGASHPYLFRGDGKLNFQDVSDDWGTGDMKGYFNGASYADLDNDGNLDLVMNCIDAPAVVLRNKAPAKNHLSISFRGNDANTNGIGCKAYLFNNGKLQYQQLMLTRGFQSSSDTRLHFGLDTSRAVDSLLVVWPDQKFQLLKNIPANERLIVYQKDASGVFRDSVFFKSTSAVFTDVTEHMPVPWKHKENNFDDFNVQYLIPHSQSTRGPKIAVGDINGDELDDLYACGAKGQAGALLIQQNGGGFALQDTAVFNIDAACEDTDAIFFDANGDGQVDLYVVSGGNEYSGNNIMLSDRLYLNDGNGHFTKSTQSLPALFANKSCVKVADVDNDKDLDVFVGTLADAKAYGVPQTSYLLLNDGKAHFSTAGENVIRLSNLGIVTAAEFADINKDGWKDLILAGEWMPITIFMNRKGNFEQSSIPQSTGLWQAIFLDDVNADGSLDILAGNWGWNNKFRASNSGPLKLYVADFDGNGQTEQLLSYSRNGEDFPFLAKDEVERALPLLKKHYLSYAEYAGVPMKKVFYGWVDTVKPFVAERLGSAVCYGDAAGNFTVHDLPEELQLSPAFCFEKLDAGSGGENNFILGGNFFDVIPYEGRYDAQALALFEVNSGTVKYPQQLLSSFKKQVRDIKWLRTAKFGKVLAIAGNNDSLAFYSFTSR